MNQSNVAALLKKYWFDGILLAAILVILFVPAIKAGILEKLVSAGFFNVEIEKGKTEKAHNADSFSYVNENGMVSTLSKLNGRVVFINFWASWCPPCLAEMPSLYKLYSRFRDDPRIIFLFVNEDNDRDKAIRYMDKNSFSFPLCTRFGASPASIYTGTLPTTVVVSKSGKLVLQRDGMAGYNTEKFIKALEALMQEPY